MVQILQPQPSTRTLRQQAFQQGIDQIGQGLAGFAGAYDQQTQRQQALQGEILKTTAALRDSGYDVTPDQVAAQLAPKESGGFLSKLFGSSEQPQQNQSDILSKRTPKYEAQQEAMEIDRQLKKTQLEELGKPYGQTREAQKALFAEDISNRKSRREMEEKKSKYKIPDFELADQSYSPTPQDVETLKKANKVSKDMANIVNSLAQNVKEYGLSSGLGATTGEQKVEKDISDLIIAIKEAANLGALSGPDMGLAEAAIGRLRGIGDKLNPFTSREEAVMGLADIVNKSNQKVESEAASRGFNRTGKVPQFINPYAKEQKGKIRVSNGKEVLEIDQEDLKDAQKDGYKAL